MRTKFKILKKLKGVKLKKNNFINCFKKLFQILKEWIEKININLKN
jgi:hypothetical protein